MAKREKNRIEPQKRKERESIERRENNKMSFYVEKSEFGSKLVRTNKSLTSLNLSLMQKCENLLHEDFLKAMTSFEYPVDAFPLEDFIGIEETFNNNLVEHQISKRELDKVLADRKSDMKLSLFQDVKWKKQLKRRDRLQRRSKLHLRRDGSFHSIAKFKGKKFTFDLEVLDSRKNSFKEEGDDVIRCAPPIIEDLMIEGKKTKLYLRHRRANKIRTITCSKEKESTMLKLMSQGSSSMFGLEVEKIGSKTK